MAVCQACGEEQIHRAVETCGHVPWNIFAKLISELDHIAFNLKHLEKLGRDMGIPVRVGAI